MCGTSAMATKMHGCTCVEAHGPGKPSAGAKSHAVVQHLTWERRWMASCLPNLKTQSIFLGSLFVTTTSFRPITRSHSGSDSVLGASTGMLLSLVGYMFCTFCRLPCRGSWKLTFLQRVHALVPIGIADVTTSPAIYPRIFSCWAPVANLGRQSHT